MKELLLDSISKIKSYIKTFIIKAEKNIRFEGSKNEVIKIMLDTVIEEKEREKSVLMEELNNIRKEAGRIERQMKDTAMENIQFQKKISALKRFREFLLDNR